jgi:hypothetical protein
MRTAQQPTEGHTLRAGTHIARSKAPDTEQEVWSVLRQDVELFKKSGDMEIPECYAAAVHGLMKLRKLTERQAVKLFDIAKP